MELFHLKQDLQKSIIDSFMAFIKAIHLKYFLFSKHFYGFYHVSSSRDVINALLQQGQHC